VSALTLLIVVTALLCASVTVLVLIGLERLAGLPSGLSHAEMSESNVDEPAHRLRPLLDDPLYVLVVDDDEGLRALLRASFEIADIEVAEAHSAKAAAISIADRHPDVIVLDVGMPEVTGLVPRPQGRPVHAGHSDLPAHGRRDLRSVGQTGGRGRLPAQAVQPTRAPAGDRGARRGTSRERS
jgi:hypothetical protein